jgi:single-stranded DNA-binding protein
VVKETPVFKEIRADSCYHQFQVGTDREWLDANGRRNRTTDWVNVIAWNKQWLTSAVQRGDLVFVSGRIQSRPIHRDETTGKTFYRTEVVADDIRNVTAYKERAMADAASFNMESGPEPDSGN